MAQSQFVWPGLFTNTGTTVTFTLPALFPDGTAAAPSMAFANEPTTGFFRNGANTIGVSVAGTTYYNFGNVSALFNRPLTFVDNTYDIGAAGATRPRSLYLGTSIAQVGASTGVGQGVPVIVANARSTAQTAAVASVVTYTPTADSTFLVSANVLVTTSTTHAFTVNCTYTDEGNTARTLNISFWIAGGTAVTSIANANGAVAYTGISTQIRVKANTAITILTAGTFTTVTYNVEGLITRIS